VARVCPSSKGAGLGFRCRPALFVDFFEPWIHELKSTKAWSHFLHGSDAELLELCTSLKRVASGLAFTEEQDRALKEAMRDDDRKSLFAVRSSLRTRILKARRLRAAMRPFSALHGGTYEPPSRRRSLHVSTIAWSCISVKPDSRSMIRGSR
jgi:hypothetical protein